MPICLSRDLGELDIGSFSIAPTYQVLGRTLPLGPPDEGVGFAVSHLPHCFVQCSLNVSKLCSFLPHNLSGMKKSNLFRKSSKGNVSPRLMCKSCWVHNCGCIRNMKFHALYNFRNDHLWGLKGIPVPAIWTKQLFSFEMSLLLPYNIYFPRTRCTFFISGAWLSFLAGRKMNTQNCGQSSARVNKRSMRIPEVWTKTRPLCPSLKTSPLWSLLTWVSLPRPHVKEDFWLLGCKKNMRNPRQPELIFYYSRNSGKDENTFILILCSLPYWPQWARELS